MIGSWIQSRWEKTVQSTKGKDRCLMPLILFEQNDWLRSAKIEGFLSSEEKSKERILWCRVKNAAKMVTMDARVKMKESKGRSDELKVDIEAY